MRLILINLILIKIILIKILFINWYYKNIINKVMLISNINKNNSKINLI